MCVCIELVSTHARTCSDNSGGRWGVVYSSYIVVSPVTIATSSTDTHAEYNDNDHNHPIAKKNIIARSSY